MKSTHYSNRLFKIRIHGKTVLTLTKCDFPKVTGQVMTVKKGGSFESHKEVVDAEWNDITFSNPLIVDESLWQEFISRVPANPEGGSSDDTLFTMDIVRMTANKEDGIVWRLFGACYKDFGETAGDAGNTDAGLEEITISYSYARKIKG